MMKKWMAALIVLLLLLPAAALAEGRMHPAYDEASGKWGYIDHSGAWALPPRFDAADVFRGDYAAAMLSDGDEDEERYHWGVIDREGNWVVEPRYMVDGGYDGWYYGGLENGTYFIWDETLAEENGKMGFFDVRSGFFSGVIYDGEVDFRNGERLVPVYLNGRACYVDRTNGQVEITLPEETDFGWPMDDAEFSNGYALVFLENGEGKEKAYLLNEAGELISPPGVVFYDVDVGLHAAVTADGLSSAQDEATKLLGYYDLNRGTWRIPPVYETIMDFSQSGYACVELPGRVGSMIIDTQGNVLAEGLRGGYPFYGEYAHAMLDGNRLINARGETAAVIPEGFRPEVQWDDELRHEYDYYASEDGLLAVSGGEQGEGVMRLNGEWVLPPMEGQYLYAGEETFSREGWRFFSEGLQAISRHFENGTRIVKLRDGGTREETAYRRKIAYINKDGEFITDFLYDSGGAFLDGLAYVERDGRSGYINENG
ncbi:MAG: WG repeat-containing protein, partial [Clostridia bacterium]|nr:WG repeat-containing protein [Clostridia bacterium]